MLLPPPIAELVARCPDRERAGKIAARYLAIEEEIDHRRKEETYAETDVTIDEMLAEGSLVKDRDGKLRPAHWLPF